MLNFIFGKSFWSTFIRAALLIPVPSLVLLPVIFIYGAPEDIAVLRSYSPIEWAAHFILALTFGAWIGWGLAYWRFDKRPVPTGWFAAFPLISGLAFGPLAFWLLIESVSVIEPIDASEKTAAMIFGAITGPLIALVCSLFWRYAPNISSSKRDRR